MAQKVCSKVEADEYEWIVDHSKVISRTSKKIAFKKHPISTVVNVMRFLNEKVYRIGICPKKYRKMIALEAPDGTGKTTFIDALLSKTLHITFLNLFPYIAECAHL